ncbi:MAG: helix-turn-helix domain-containing protein [Gemmatimonadales bacterium]
MDPQSGIVPDAPLPESCAVTIVDLPCAGHDTARGEEECVPTHEVVVPRRGAYLREVRGETCWVDAGTVTFSHPDEGYRIQHPAPGGDVCTAFALSAEAARELLGPEGRFPRAHAPLEGGAYLLHRLALGAARQARERSAAGLAAEEYAVAFLHAALASRPPADARAGENAIRARAVVSRRYREPLTLARIARASGCSAFHLSRQFTRSFGIPIWRFVVRLRLRDALEQILETRDGLSCIGLAAGFASQSHFGDAFRREFGCAPGRVRRLPAPALAELRERAGIR